MCVRCEAETGKPCFERVGDEFEVAAKSPGIPLQRLLRQARIPEQPTIRVLEQMATNGPGRGNGFRNAGFCQEWRVLRLNMTVFEYVKFHDWRLRRTEIADFLQIDNGSLDPALEHLDLVVLVGGVQAITVQPIPHHDYRNLEQVVDVGNNRD